MSAWMEVVLFSVAMFLIFACSVMLLVIAYVIVDDVRS